MEEIILEPIGFINSPFKRLEDIPRQSIYANEKTAWIKIKDEYREGLKDIERFSHIIVLFYFNQSDHYDLLTTTHFSSKKRGIFGTRSPHRPNHIGLSIVELIGVNRNNLEIKGVDMLDNTPVLDIKPYSPGLNPCTRE
jgi:tRNA-Thr(GGU) m(6)t(6)A37 methyltransferase TsaA